MKRFGLFLLFLLLCQPAYANVHFESLIASKRVSNTVASTIQAGGSITGNVANLTNGNIKLNQTIAAATVQSQNTSTTANGSAVTNTAINNNTGFSTVTAKTANVSAVTNTAINNNTGLSAFTAKTAKVGNNNTGLSAPTAKTAKTGNAPAAITPLTPLNRPVIQLPKGTNGLFVVSRNPQSQFLIETNPAFTMYSNFISSNYLLQHIGYSPLHAMKRLGDAFYENRLILESMGSDSIDIIISNYLCHC